MDSSLKVLCTVGRLKMKGLFISEVPIFLFAIWQQMLELFPKIRRGITWIRIGIGVGIASESVANGTREVGAVAYYSPFQTQVEEPVRRLGPAWAWVALLPNKSDIHVIQWLRCNQSASFVIFVHILSLRIGKHGPTVLLFRCMDKI